jgi:hypothetical protein
MIPPRVRAILSVGLWQSACAFSPEPAEGLRSMLRVSSFTALAALSFSLPAFGQATVTFENPTLNQPLVGQNTYQNGATLSPSGSFATMGATFNNNYDAMWDVFSGWAYSNVADATTPGFGNQFAAYNISGSGSGDGSANYGIAFASNPGDATVQLPAGLQPHSMRVTNTTYAGLSMLNGDQFAKKFGGVSGNDPDWFLLTINGFNAANEATGTVEFYLADYRFSDNSQDYIISEWTTVDLSAFGAGTSYLSFGLSSSDVGNFGMNTPAYFAADNFSFNPVPEPSMTALVALAGIGVWLRRR